MGKKFLDLTNRQFGKFTVICKTDDHIRTNGKHITMWHCKCKCGQEHDISEECLLAGATGVCKCSWRYFTPTNFNDLTGQKFGRLTVIRRSSNLNNSTMWDCVCECGNTTTVDASALVTGNTTSCGCYSVEVASNNFKDITGVRFGRLVALERNVYKKNSKRSQVTWKCRCDCGNIVDITYDNLSNGNTNSCGCLKKELTTKLFLDDLTGQMFGNLTVVRRAEDYISPSGNHQTQWECKCSCGNTKIVHANSLKQGYTKSCGCISYSNGEDVISDILTLNNISFKQHESFDDCRFLNTNRMAEFDFFVNNEYIIEYDGEQHFLPVAFNGSKTAIQNFKKTKEHDLFKNRYCFNKQIPIIRIPYTHLKNICIEDLMLETTSFLLTDQNEYDYYVRHGGEIWLKE